MTTGKPSLRALGLAAAAALLTTWPLGAASSRSAADGVSEVIVQGAPAPELERWVGSVEGVVTGALPIIGAITAELAPEQMAELEREHPEIRLHPDRPVTSTAGRERERGGDDDDDDDDDDDGDDDDWRSRDRRCRHTLDTAYPRLVGASPLHERDVTGRGITVAVVDSGLAPLPGLLRNADGDFRVLARYDALRDGPSWWPGSGGDANGHGTHVTSVIMSSRRNCSGDFDGVAPGADLVAVRVLGEQGSGRYIDVIRGLDWVLVHEDDYAIRVVNLSLSAPARTHYWDDPLNQAVMKLWQAGIVVVTAAGNRGPDPLTIGVPANTPYVLSVGALSDGGTPDDRSDDRVTAFSSAGPTVEGFVKPELVAPGHRVLGLVPRWGWLSRRYPQIHEMRHYARLSGTSPAAAVVSGVVTLLLQEEPWLTPDDVKARLLESARAGTTSAGEPGFSVFRQGAGLVDAEAAVSGSAGWRANAGLDIDKDLLGLEHYGGPAGVDGDGSYYVVGLDREAYAWDGSELDADAYLWQVVFLWNDAYLWAVAWDWSEEDVRNDAYLWLTSLRLGDERVWSDSLRERVYPQIVIEPR